MGTSFTEPQQNLFLFELISQETKHTNTLLKMQHAVVAEEPQGMPLPHFALEQELAVVLTLSGEFEDAAPAIVEIEAPVQAAVVEAPVLPEFKRVSEEKEPEYPNNATRQIMRELKELASESYSQKQLKVEIIDDNPFELNVILTPSDGIYKDGYYEMVMTLSKEYPSKKPTFHCPCEIFHPNVNSQGAICFSLLGESASHLRITDYAHGLLWLLYYPNLYSRMNPSCPQDEQKFAQLARTSIVGGTVRGRQYKRSRCLPAEKNEGEEKLNLKGECDGKEWVWKLVGEEWVQVFDALSSS